MSDIKHKVFISYHHDDQEEVNQFVETFDEKHEIFIARSVGIGMAQDIVDSDDTDYVMHRIKELYLRDSTVTIVLMGKCTWARRYVDWELQASLRSGETVTPNGLLGIKLPSFPGKEGYFPNRLNMNLKQSEEQEDCYARWMAYPTEEGKLKNAIDAALDRRVTHRKWINNPRERMSYNRSCP